jgi:hypothetical protein
MVGVVEEEAVAAMAAPVLADATDDGGLVPLVHDHQVGAIESRSRSSVAAS